MSEHQQPQVDAVVIGAGFAGLYQAYCLHKEGFTVQGIEAGSDVGGTWYWNRYPGARTDSPSNVYQYLFSEELVSEWQWSQRFPAQEETERYLQWVAEKLDLKRHFNFNTRVSRAVWSEQNQLWQVTAEDGWQVTARFIVSCMGPLSKPVIPEYPGKDTYQGQIVHTTRWPKEGIDLAGKKVGVVGTGATGIQVVQTIADEVQELTVFQRTANYTIPMRNFEYSAEEPLQVDRPKLRELSRQTFGGFEFDLDPREWGSVTPEERRATMERLWSDGTLALWVGSFAEGLQDPVANAEVTSFVKEKIGARISDPELAAKLIPSDHGFGTHRVPLETGYYEQFAKDHVHLIDAKVDPIQAFTPAGVRTEQHDIALDVVIFATGFDAVTGALTNIDVRGREGRVLSELWGQDVRTAMGMQIHGFPNLFLTSAPLSPAGAFCNVPTCAQHTVEWITECIGYVSQHGNTIEPTAEFEAEWVAHHDEVADTTLIAKTKSWYTGANIDGKPSRLIGYPGVGPYVEACEKVRTENYAGFNIE